MGGPENYMPSERSRMLQAEACDSMIGGPRLDGQRQEGRWCFWDWGTLWGAVSWGGLGAESSAGDGEEGCPTA